MLPYLSGQVLNAGAFTAVPRYWYQAAAFLAARSPLNTALVVPADAHGDYLWGDPIDDPLVAAGLLAVGRARPRALRRRRIADPAADRGRRRRIRRAGHRAGRVPAAGRQSATCVVRNDLDPGQVGYTSPALVHQTLALSGFTRVASFGPLIGGAQVEPGPPAPSRRRCPATRRSRSTPRRPRRPVPPRRQPAAATTRPDPPAEPGDHPARQPDRAGRTGDRTRCCSSPGRACSAPAARRHRRATRCRPARAVGASPTGSAGPTRCSAWSTPTSPTPTPRPRPTRPAPASSAGRAARPGSCCRSRPPGTRPWPCSPARPA